MRALAGFALSILLAAAPAAAQDPASPPRGETLALSAGFEPDPHVISAPAGGDVDARAAGGPACAGYVAEAASVRLFYAGGGGLPLMLSAREGPDTLILVNRPDGRWTCAGAAVGARLRLERPSSGQYDIWLGARAPGEAGPVTLEISEAREPR